jgi:hypothetical protein
MRDQCPRLTNKLTKASWQGKVVIEIVHEFYSVRSFPKRKKVKNLDELKQNKYHQVNNDQHYQCIVLQVIREF